MKVYELWSYVDWERAKKERITVEINNSWLNRRIAFCVLQPTTAMWLSCWIVGLGKEKKRGSKSWKMGTALTKEKPGFEKCAIWNISLPNDEKVRMNLYRFVYTKSWCSYACTRATNQLTNQQHKKNKKTKTTHTIHIWIESNLYQQAAHLFHTGLFNKNNNKANRGKNVNSILYIAHQHLDN